jgi:UDP-N-acetylmuramate-alanine ligase
MSFAAFDPRRIDQIVESLSAMLQRHSIARELETLKQFAVAPEEVDEIVLAAIDASLNLQDKSLVRDIPQLRIDGPSISSTAVKAA